MQLKEFVEESLKNLGGLESGVVEFDVAVYGAAHQILVTSKGDGASRIKFAIKLEKKADK